jgi:hypothetical protein
MDYSAGGDSDNSIIAGVQAATTVAELLGLLQRWYNWGDHDSTGVMILTKLGELGEGNSEAIAALASSSKGNIHRTRYAAQNALSVLADKGDPAALAALNESHAYWQAQAIANPSFIDQRRAAAAAKAAAEKAAAEKAAAEKANE